MKKPILPRAPHLSGRRRLLTALAAGGGVVVARKGLPEHWGAPVVDAVSLPAHAAATGDGFTGSQTLPLIVQQYLPTGRRGETRGLARFFDAPPGQPVSRGLAARVGDLLVPGAQANPDISTGTLEGFALVSGNMATLLQLRVTIRVQVPEGGLIKEEEVKECEVAVDEAIQILFQRNNMPEGGSPVNLYPVNCREGGLSARIASISPGVVIVDISFMGEPTTLVLTPGGSPFPIPADCKAQRDDLKETIIDSCPVVAG